jgi:outer membrane protein assembly factor BamB
MKQNSGLIRKALFAFLCVTALAATAAFAADWPQWRGPARTGISHETAWTHQWPGGGPKKVWSKNVGQGFSSVAVVNGKLYTLGYANGKDTVHCLNATTGKPVWSYSYPCGAGDYEGPRATPTVDGDKVYIMSREGGVLCLNATTGKVVWGRDVAREQRAEQPQWGFAGSPLVEGNLVIFNIGGAGTALDKNTGKVMWRSNGDMAGYASPVAYTMGGQRAVAIFSGSGVVTVNPANGRTLWRHPWDTAHNVNAADPILAGTDVFISSNYGRGCALLRPSGSGASVVWENRNMKNHFNTCVLVKGYLYGNDENTLKCIDLRSGKEMWRMRGMDKGGLIAADGKLIVLTGRGELVIAAATPDAFKELARAQVLQGTTWTHPALANGMIYARSYEGDLVCLDVRGK